MKIPQFKIDGQFPSFRRDRDKHGGGKVVFAKEGFIVNRIKELETNKLETICLELSISNKNMGCYIRIQAAQ